MQNDFSDEQRNLVRGGTNPTTGYEAEKGLDQAPPRLLDRRTARQHTIRWWSERYDLPLSTLYKAIEKGYLKAIHPRGGSFIILPEEFWAWYGADAENPSPHPTPIRSTASAKTAAAFPQFQHVRWSELPGEPPDAAAGS